jgi:putative endonuclease
MKTQRKGQHAEQLALNYLQKQGLQLLARNYSCRFGEIDLIVLDKPFVVFVEVRARRSMVFGGASASVTYTKQQKIIKTAAHYLSLHALHNKMPARFDVIGIEGDKEELHWIKHAFV